MPRIKVAVLRGGPSHGYDESLKTGAYVLSLLREMPESYDPLDVFISRKGEWHRNGIVEDPHGAMMHTDVVWNALHGSYGEGGQVQRILENLQIPFTGAGTIAAALSINKDLAKGLYRRHGMLTPAHELVTEEGFTDEKIVEIFRNYLHPVIVKPVDGSHSLGVKMAHTFKELKEAIKETFNHSKKVLVEEFIKGAVVSSPVIDKARGEKLYALVPTGGRTQGENEKITEMSKLAHEVLGLRHYSSSDFIITPRGKIYILETNSLPVLHEESEMHKSLEATGWRPHDFTTHCINLALGKE
ncbi:MAG: ATP-grasp domain-containing protein [Candidatus Zambryskibacteria bacterium]|nr:ATP-grasp domain-containing protein [Candidatus Zambryskibacteria bacterium]